MEEAGDIYFLVENDDPQEQQSVFSEVLSDYRNVWSENATKMLISLYGKNERNFRNNKIKNDSIWRAISDELKNSSFNFSAKQAENKWKHLKKLYMKQIDNMGAKGTGEEPIKFRYFEEMDELFAKKPVVKPVAVASSSRGTQLNIEEIKDCDFTESSISADEVNVRKRGKQSENEDETPRKIPKSSVALIGYLKESNEIKELAREKRHEETLEIQCKALEAFTSVMHKLIEKM